MKHACTLLAVLLGSVAHAQLHVDQPLVLTSTDSTQRQIEGIAPPVSNDALITAGSARLGAVHVAVTGGTANVITLALQPAATTYSNGMLVRFAPALTPTGAVTLNVDGLGPKPLRRNDGLPVTLGELIPGAWVEAQYADSIFLLLGRGEAGCPNGYIQVNGQYCIQQNDVNNQTWFTGVQYCATRGARLCTWDEYYYACSQLQGQMTGLFDDWEWVDDTADHTHTAVQVGRWVCQSERSIGAVDAEIHSTRCCYRLR